MKKGNPSSPWMRMMAMRLMGRPSPEEMNGEELTQFMGQLGDSILSDADRYQMAGTGEVYPSVEQGGAEITSPYQEALPPTPSGPSHKINVRQIVLPNGQRGWSLKEQR